MTKSQKDPSQDGWGEDFQAKGKRVLDVRLG